MENGQEEEIEMFCYAVAQTGDGFPEAQAVDHARLGTIR